MSTTATATAPTHTITGVPGMCFVADPGPADYDCSLTNLTLSSGWTNNTTPTFGGSRAGILNVMVLSSSTPQSTISFSVQMTQGYFEGYTGKGYGDYQCSYDGGKTFGDGKAPDSSTFSTGNFCEADGLSASETTTISLRVMNGTIDLLMASWSSDVIVIVTDSSWELPQSTIWETATVTDSTTTAVVTTTVSQYPVFEPTEPTQTSFPISSIKDILPLALPPENFSTMSNSSIISSILPTTTPTLNTTFILDSTSITSPTSFETSAQISHQISSSILSVNSLARINSTSTSLPIPKTNSTTSSPESSSSSSSKILGIPSKQFGIVAIAVGVAIGVLAIGLMIWFFRSKATKGQVHDQIPPTNASEPPTKASLGVRKANGRHQRYHRGRQLLPQSSSSSAEESSEEELLRKSRAGFV